MADQGSLIVTGTDQAEWTGCWQADPLGFLLAPVDTATFRAEFRGHAPLHARSGAGRTHLLSLADIDSYLAAAELRTGMVDIVSHGERVPPEAFTGRDGRIAAHTVAAHRARGATIVLPQLDCAFPRLGAFCGALEEALSAPIQANAYLSPPGSRGFVPHYDTHDVFALQIAGSKLWRLFGEPLPADAPFRPGDRDPGPATLTLTLRPGDCLYVPRGLVHEAVNQGGEPSLHISFG